ncbi:MAG: hypothetical protein QOC97_307 [Chloroflexota bacterium]|nr:hypothetical protein [Chloroflexota bacterium]
MNESDEVRELTCDEVREMAGAFVLGALTPADDAAVRAHLASCDDAHAEIDELGGVLPALAESVPIVEPPDRLKARIMAAAAADLEERGVAPSAAAPTASPAPALAASPAPANLPATPAGLTPFPTVGQGAARRSRLATSDWLLRIAAVLAIVALGGWNILLQGQLDGAKTYQQSVDAVLEVAAQPGARTAILTAADGTGSGLAAISASGQVTIAIQDLPATAGTSVYTVWSIAGTNGPVPLGDFKVGDAGTATFSGTGVPTVGGVVIALTHEPTPGAKAPTGPIISKGSVS